MMTFKVVPKFIFVLLYFINCYKRVNSDDKEAVAIYFWSEKDLEDEGNQLREHGKFREALPYYNTLVKKKSSEKLYLHYVHRGKCHMEIDHCGFQLKAVNDFKSALEKAPKSFEKGTRIVKESDLVILAEKILKHCDISDQKIQHKILWCYNETIRGNSSEDLYRYYLLRGKFRSKFNNCYDCSWAVDDLQIAFKKAPKNSDGEKPLVEESILVGLAEKISNYCNSGQYASIGKKIKWCYDKAIEMNPFNAKHFRKRGIVKYENFADYESAALDLRQAIQLDSEDEENYKILENIILYSTQFGDPIKESMTLLNDDSLRSLCANLKNREKYREALYCSSEVIERNPGNKELEKIYLERASCYLAMNQLEMAIYEHKNLLQLNLHDIKNCWFSFTELLFRHGKFKEFEDEVKILNADELGELAGLFVHENKFEYAIWVYNEAIERDLSKVLYYKLRGDCYLKMENKDDAIADLKIWVEKNPANKHDRMNYKMLLINDSKTKELVELGLEYIQGNKFRPAIDVFNGALTKDAKCEICYEKRALCHWKLKNYEEAISDLEEAIKLANWDLIPKIDLSEVLVDAQEYDKAKNLLKNLLVELDQSTYPEGVEKINQIKAKIEN